VIRKIPERRNQNISVVKMIPRSFSSGHHRLPKNVTLRSVFVAGWFQFREWQKTCSQLHRTNFKKTNVDWKALQCSFSKTITHRRFGFIMQTNIGKKQMQIDCNITSKHNQ